MPRRTLKDKRVLVTGASSGIGRALALQLANHGAHVLVTARREEELAKLCEEIRESGGKCEFLAGDITDAMHREELITHAVDRLDGLDILVNNAGVGAVRPFVEADSEQLRTIFELNFFAPVELIRAALPQLRTGVAPLIVNVSSVLGHRAVPSKSEYCASKFALHGFSDALRAELAEECIDVLLVSPSTTASPFWDNVLTDDGTKQTGGVSPDVVASEAISAMCAGRHEVILTWGGKLLVWLDRIWPWLADWIIAKYA